MSGIPWESREPVGGVARQRADVAWWGMLLFLLNEGTLFASLVASYFFLAAGTTSWPPAGVEKPALRLPLAMTAALLGSSVALIWADRGLEQRDRRRYRIGIAATMLLGAAFLAMQTIEYVDKLKTLSPTASSYASIFYTITGLHGTHVFVGVLFLAWALARERVGPASPRTTALKNASLYWHFVDGVWLVIFTSLYLSPRWM